MYIVLETYYNGRAKNQSGLTHTIEVTNVRIKLTCFRSCSKFEIFKFLVICLCLKGKHIFYSIIVLFMQFPALHFVSDDHYGL